jgi:hypothetical protein
MTEETQDMIGETQDVLEDLEKARFKNDILYANMSEEDINKKDHLEVSREISQAIHIIHNLINRDLGNSSLINS